MLRMEYVSRKGWLGICLVIGVVSGVLLRTAVFSRLPSFLDLGPSGGRVWDGDGIERVGLRRMSGLGWKGFWDIGSLLVGWLVGLEEEPDG